MREDGSGVSPMAKVGALESQFDRHFANCTVLVTRAKAFLARISPALLDIGVRSTAPSAQTA